MSPQSRNPHYWRNLALAALLMLVSGGCVLSASLAVILVDNVGRLLKPPRTPITQTPPDYGITTYRDVTFTSSDGITLRGWYMPSQSGAAVILAHGYVDNREFLLPEAAFLTRAGYGVLMFDFRGHGDSGSAIVTLGDHEQRDLRAALDFVVAQPDVDPDRIGGLGFSMGAATLAGVAAQDDRLRAVVIESSYTTLDAVLKERLNVPDLLRDPVIRVLEWRAHGNIKDVRPIDDLCKISPRPVFLIYGDQDTVLPPGSAQQMFAAACPPVETWLIHGLGHVYYRDHKTPGYEERILAFFEQGLAVPN